MISDFAGVGLGYQIILGQMGHLLRLLQPTGQKGWDNSIICLKDEHAVRINRHNGLLMACLNADIDSERM